MLGKGLLDAQDTVAHLMIFLYVAKAYYSFRAFELTWLKLEASSCWASLSI